MRTSDAIDKIATALAAAQGEMDGAKKSARNPFFNSKFADLASVKDALREPFAKHGLSTVQFPQTAYSGTPEAFEWTAKRSGEVRHGVRVFCTVTVETRLMHTSGQWLEDSVSAMLPNGDPQAVGSAITYLRRYALQAIAGIATEDDDAETAQGSDRAERAPVGTLPIQQHPEGYLVWLDGTFRAAAVLGTTALEQAWLEAPHAYRAHLETHGAELKATLKAIAARKVA
jgi:hypothetical protein